MSRPNRHICVVIANLPAERDRRVIRECQSLEAQGYAVTIIAPRGDPDLRILPGAAGTRLRPYPVRVLGHNVATFAVDSAGPSCAWPPGWSVEVMCGRAHAVQVCNPPDVYWPLALLVRAIGRPWVFDHHDLCPEIYADPGRATAEPTGRPHAVRLRMADAADRHCSGRHQCLLPGQRAAAGRAAGPVIVVRNGPRRREIAMTGDRRRRARRTASSTSVCSAHRTTSKVPSSPPRQLAAPTGPRGLAHDHRG